MIQKIPLSPTKFVVWASRPHLSWAVVAIIAVVTALVFTRLQYYTLAELTDAGNDLVNDFAGSNQNLDTSLVKYWALWYVATVILSQLIFRISGFCGMRWVTGMSAFINKSLFEYLINHSKQYFSNNFAGALTNKISNAARGAESLVTRSLWEFMPLILGAIANIALAAAYHAQLAWALGIWFVVLLAISASCSLYLRPIFYKSAEANSTLTGKLVDCTSNIDSVQHAGFWEYELRYATTFIEKVRALHLKSWWHSELVLILNNILVTIFLLSMLWMSIYLFEIREISVGVLILIIIMNFNFSRELFFIGQRLAETMGDYGKIQEGLDLLLKTHDLTNQKNAKELQVVKASIKIENLCFNYDNIQVFNNLNLFIPAGQKVGLVGYSGAGKSTLVNLILRQYDLNSGQILIDDQDISKVTLESLRKQIAMVPQNISLFHRSILENIRYGRLEATEQEVQNAAKLAFADPFILQIPQQYQALVGERGVKLSGGQKQRIAIARAFLKNAPILLLDEATSALDTESEAIIQRALLRLMQNKTVLAIAHRLSTLQAMDRILVLDKSGIAEDGTHKELLAQQGQYAKLWRSQVDGFIGEEQGEG